MRIVRPVLVLVSALFLLIPSVRCRRHADRPRCRSAGERGDGCHGHPVRPVAHDPACDTVRSRRHLCIRASRSGPLHASHRIRRLRCMEPPGHGPLRRPRSACRAADCRFQRERQRQRGSGQLVADQDQRPAARSADERERRQRRSSCSTFAVNDLVDGAGQRAGRQHLSAVRRLRALHVARVHRRRADGGRHPQRRQPRSHAS